MISALQISAFDNSVSSYMIHADGRVVLDNAVKRQKNIYNFLAMLRKYSDLSSEEIQNFQSNLENGTSGAMALHIGDVGYYLTYESAEFEDWVLVGLVPTSVVNASMNKLQYSTIFLAVGIMIAVALLAIMLMVGLLISSKLKSDETEKERYPDHIS